MGRFKQIARFDPSLDERVLSAEHGWWFPERDLAEPVLGGGFDCNPNNVIPMCENGTNGYGAPVKCGIAKVYPCTPEDDTPDAQPSWQVSRTNGYVHAPSHKSETPSFYDINR